LGAFFFNWSGAALEYWAPTPMMSRTSLLAMAGMLRMVNRFGVGAGWFFECEILG
jgi:hypothetical protein